MYAIRCLCVLLCLSLSGCIIHVSDSGDGGWDWGDHPILKGSGVRGTEARVTGEFRRVRSSLAGDVHVVVGKETRVEVSCDDNLLEHVRTLVVDGELQLETDGQPMAFRDDLRIEIACPALEAATLSGSGALAVEGLSGERFEASLSGSGELSARGKVARASLSLTGSGDLACRELLTEEAQVSLSGSGDVRVHASASLSASVSGSGDVRYSGSPARVTRSVAGSGTIAPE